MATPTGKGEKTIHRRQPLQRRRAERRGEERREEQIGEGREEKRG